MLLQVGGSDIRIGLAFYRTRDDRSLVLTGCDECNLLCFHDRRHAHGDGFGRHVLFAKEIAGSIAPSHCVERDATSARVGPGARFVEPNVARLTDTEYLQIDAAAFFYRYLVGLALHFDIVAQNIAARDVDVLRAHVDVVEEILPHEPMIAVDALRPHRVVLIEIERHHIGEIETFLAVHLDQLAVDPNRRASRCEPEHGVPTFSPALLDYLGDTSGDGASDLVVFDDDYGDSFLGGWHFSRRNEAFSKDNLIAALPPHRYYVRGNIRRLRRSAASRDSS